MWTMFMQNNILLGGDTPASMGYKSKSRRFSKVKNEKNFIFQKGKSIIFNTSLIVKIPVYS